MDAFSLATREGFKAQKHLTSVPLMHSLEASFLRKDSESQILLTMKWISYPADSLFSSFLYAQRECEVRESGTAFTLTRSVCADKKKLKPVSNP